MKNVALYISISVIAFVISKMIMAILCYRRWKAKQKLKLKGGKLVMFNSPRIKALKPSMFVKKTMKLGNKDIIGSGGFGTVYKLMIDDSVWFAVKRLNRLGEDQERGFERELEAM